MNPKPQGPSRPHTALAMSGIVLVILVIACGIYYWRVTSNSPQPIVPVSTVSPTSAASADLSTTSPDGVTISGTSFKPGDSVQISSPPACSENILSTVSLFDMTKKSEVTSVTFEAPTTTLQWMLSSTTDPDSYYFNIGYSVVTYPGAVHSPDCDESSYLSKNLKSNTFSVVPVWQTYTNNQYGFSIQHLASEQAADTGPQNDDGQKYDNVNFENADGSRIFEVSILLNSSQAACNTMTIGDSTNATSSTVIDGISFVEETAIGERSYATDYCTVKGSTVYELTVSLESTSDGFDPSTHVNNDEIFNQMLSSFRFTN